MPKRMKKLGSGGPPATGGLLTSDPLSERQFAHRACREQGRMTAPREHRG